MFHELEENVIAAYKMSEGYSEEETVATDHRLLQVRAS